MRCVGAVALRPRIVVFVLLSASWMLKCEDHFHHLTLVCAHYERVSLPCPCALLTASTRAMLSRQCPHAASPQSEMRCCCCSGDHAPGELGESAAGGGPHRCPHRRLHCRHGPCDRVRGVVSMRKRPVEPAHSVMPGALVCLSFLRRCDRMKAIGAHRAHKSSRAPCVAERRGRARRGRGARARDQALAGVGTALSS